MIKKNIIFFTLVLVIAGCNTIPAGDEENQDSGKKLRLVWQDEFNYTGLPDSDKWDYDTAGNDAGWGNNEVQYYSRANRENAWVDNGRLKIVALKKTFGEKNFTSARLLSKSNWKYGRIEVNAKVPKGRGTWSAIWMMPGDWSFYDGNWPDVGEIDIMEHVGHETGIIHASAHSKDYQWQKGTQKTAVINVPDASGSFHTYALEWDAEVMKISVDDSIYFVYENEKAGESKWPYDKSFYLIMNIAVGGAWGAMKGIDTSAFPQTMEIDWVRVFQKTG
ncbi:MAG TPA: glycoside hydrolase family 16 protein [Bacteroidales bacterium]|nr:glycoside hydrolase family 16 protein [Bacteroidales bacterium]